MILLYLCILLLPWLLGKGILMVLYGKGKFGEFSLWDNIITGVIVAVGLGEVSHLCTLFLNRSFSFYTVLFGGLAGSASVAAAVLLMLGHKRGSMAKERTASQWKAASEGTRPGDHVLLYGIPVLLFGTQMAYILLGSPYLQGDMTVETVLSFFHTDSIYQVNPMTGGLYVGGMPLRLKILGLSSLYGGISRIFSLDPQVVVWSVIPCVTLACCYGAFSCIGRCLFPEDPKKRCCFLTLVGLLLWAGNYVLGMDGFGVLGSGWRGIVIRNVVLIPWLISLCLRKRWKPVVLCVAAEACMTWTFYGAGACLLIAVSLAVLDRAGQKVIGKGRREAAG